MSIDLDVKLCLGQDHVATSIGAETAVMSLKRGRYYAVGKVAERIWTLLESPISPREICEKLQKEYDVAPDRCEAEVSAFLGKLIEEELVTEHRP